MEVFGQPGGRCPEVPVEGGGKCLAFAYQMPVCLATTSSSVVTILCERALFGQRVQAAVLHLRRRVI